MGGPCDEGFDFGLIARNAFSGCAGGWGSEVGDEVGDGGVGFMSNGRNHGDIGGCDGAGDHFFVESPKIFEASATSTDDEGIDYGCGAA